MTIDAETEAASKVATLLTRIEPVTFNGVDCGVLAERYVAYHRGRGLERAEADLQPEVEAEASENV